MGNRINLQKATEAYAVFGDALGINPISEIDANILSIWFDIIERLSVDDKISELLAMYKVLPDEEYLGLLQEYYKSFKIDRKKHPMLSISDKFVGDLAMIFAISSYEKYDAQLKRNINVLVINKSENVKVPYANTEIEFFSEKEFKTVYENLKRQLETYKNVIFV